MVLRMSISSVPGTNSVFFVSFSIDYLPIDKVWEKVRALGRDCQVARGGSNPTLKPEARGRSRYFQTRRANSAVASDKMVLLKAALEGRLRSTYPESRIDEFPRYENKAAGSDACRHQLQTSSAASTGAGPAVSAGSQIGAHTCATGNASRFVCV